LDSPGKAVQLGKDALKAKVDYDLGVVDKAAAGARSAASAVYDFGRDLKTELPNTTAKQGLQALSNFGEGVTGEAIADYGEEGKSAIGKLALGAGVLAGMVGGEGEVAGARRIGRGLYSRLDDAFKLIPDKPMHPNAIMNLLKKAPGGVSTEEMAYRGVPEFLAGHGEKPVSRAALAAHLEANPAPMPTVKTLAQHDPPDLQRRLLDAEAQATEAFDRAFPSATTNGVPWAGDRLSQLDDANARHWAWQAAAGDVNATNALSALAVSPERLDAINKYGRLQNEYFTLNKQRTARSRYSQYQVPGGENYRETLMTLPDKAPEGVPDGFTVKQSSNGQWGCLAPDQWKKSLWVWGYQRGSVREVPQLRAHRQA
jgi:hypothetical protein